MTKPALGRGLNALLGGAPRTSAAASAPTPAPAAPSEPPAADGIRRVPLDQVQPCAFQPRRDFSTEELQELAESIREQGILQPLIVRRRGDDYELIAGERRWRAAKLAGLNEVPALVREADDLKVLELALIENLQREDLNPIEEAEGYRQLAERFQLRQEDIAARVGRSRVSVANALRLLKLPDALQAHVRNGQLSVGHAKVILGLEVADRQTLAVDRVLRDGLNVRQTEDLVARLQAPSARTAVGGRTGSLSGPDPHLGVLQERLQERLGTRVRLRYRKGKGSVEIQFFSDDDLERVLELIGITPE
ncbi:MAG: ParB/RepB/Spo0J family partition protein [Verrucomicrobiae bacterium]|nr:ParB/RepB/Spo0J family partition protein [Verrucomicrobiae bacterium]